MSIGVLLQGGPHDGKHASITFSRQQTIVLPHPISVCEYRALDIDGVIMWKAPEDFYHRGEDGVYRFDRTVHYKPD